MTDRDVSLIERLRQAENPRRISDWKDQDGYYVATCRASADDVPRLIEIVRRWGDCDWPDSEDELDIDSAGAELLPVTAWRTLADLKAEAAVQPLVDLLLESDDEFDDWLSEDLPHVFGKIGEAAIEPLIGVATDRRTVEFKRSIAVRGLRYVAEHHAHTRDRVVACLTEMMAGAAQDDVHFNSSLLVELVDLHAVEAAEPIERAFAGSRIDLGLMGDWEVVRRELGVQGLGLKMPENPYNSMEQFRTQVGIGIFSDRPIFLHGEIQVDAERAYYEQAWHTFSKSSEAQAVVDRFGDLGWFQSLLDYGINYLGETVDLMTPSSVKNFVLDYVPRKVSTEPGRAASIVCELTAFWEYLDRVYELPEAKSIVEWLKTDGLTARLEAELSDPSNFGMAKSIVMLGKNAGYDMTSEAGVAEFIAAFNESMFAGRAPAAPLPPRPRARPITGDRPTVRRQPIAREEKVGRNDPCPCGSGKKYKKCCGGPTRRGVGHA